MRPGSDFYLRLNFKQSQLDAMVQLYKKYFEPNMPAEYDGTGVIGLWGKDAHWETGRGADAGHKHKGIVVKECREDPLWNEFSEILPYMAKSATITKIPPGAVMIPHIDRAWRPNAIYFPVSGCTEKCYSEYYNLPKPTSRNSQAIQTFPPAAYSYSVSEFAYLTNVHEWHGVRNTSDVERVAFGWNMLSAEYSFDKCKKIMVDAGYVHPNQD